MILRLGLVCTLLISSLAYSNQHHTDIAIEYDDEDEDYSDMEGDIEILREEDRLHN